VLGGCADRSGPRYGSASIMQEAGIPESGCVFGSPPWRPRPTRFCVRRLLSGLRQKRPARPRLPRSRDCLVAAGAYPVNGRFHHTEHSPCNPVPKSTAPLDRLRSVGLGGAGSSSLRRSQIRPNSALAKRPPATLVAAESGKQKALDVLLVTFFLCVGHSSDAAKATRAKLSPLESSGT
jgi:hypothetical protein